MCLKTISSLIKFAVVLTFECYKKGDKMKFGFEQNEEFLPTFDKFKDTFSQRKLFLEFFNNQVKKELRFNKQEICSCKRFSLCDIFKQKILRLLNVSFVPFTVNCTPKHPINKPIVFLMHIYRNYYTTAICQRLILINTQRIMI